MSKPVKEKDLVMLALTYLVTLCPIVLFAWMMQWYAVLALAPIGLFSFLFRRPFKFIVLRWFASAVVVAALMTIYKMFFPIPDNTTVSLLFPELYTHAFLGIAVMCLFFEQSTLNIGMCILFSYVSTIMAGSKGMGFGNQHAIFFTGTTVFVIALLLLLRRMGHRGEHYIRRERIKGKGLRLFVTLMVFAIAIMMVLPMSKVFFGMYNYIELKAYNLFKFTPPAGQLSSSLNMWRTPPSDWDRESQVVVRVRSEKCPEYMRGYVFEKYAVGRWTHAKDHNDLTAQPINSRVTSFTSHQPEHLSGDEASVQVAKGLANGRIMLTPANTYEIQSSASAIGRDRNNTFFPQFTKRKDGMAYDIKVEYSKGPAHTGPNAVESEDVAYLQVPKQLHSILDDVVDEILQGRSPQSVPEAEIQARLALYFLNNYEYELGVELDADRDPIEQFITGEKKGHCTLFAAASALLLRRMEIPARVVTGYVCVEPHPSGGYWLSRLNCAHAWAEAYSKEKGRWILIENTPASDLPTGASNFNILTSISDYFSWHVRSLIDALKSGGLKAAWFQLVQSITSALLWLASNILLLVFVIMLISLFTAKKILKRYTQKAKDEIEDEDTKMLIKDLKRIEARLKRMGVTREPHSTIREYIQQIKQNYSPAASNYIPLLEEYEILRYQKQIRTQESLNEFHEHLASTLSR